MLRHNTGVKGANRSFYSHQSGIAVPVRAELDAGTSSWGAPYGPPFVRAHCRHHSMCPVHSIVHYARSRGDLVSFVLTVPGLEEGVLLGGQASG